MLIIGGTVLLFGALIGFMAGGRSCAAGGTVSVLAAAGMIALGVMAIRAAKPFFQIWLTTNAGEVRALTAKDEGTAQAVRDAIFRAIGEVGR